MKGVAMFLYAIEMLKMASGWSKSRYFGGFVVDGGKEKLYY